LFIKNKIIFHRFVLDDIVYIREGFGKDIEKIIEPVFKIFPVFMIESRLVVRITERTQAGLFSARAKGKMRRRPRELSPKAEPIAYAAETLYRKGTLSVPQICHQFMKNHITPTTETIRLLEEFGLENSVSILNS